MKKTLFILLSLVMLTGCSNKAQQRLGVVTTGPNEYKVDKQRSLEIPPHYDLVEPTVVNKSDNKKAK